MAESFEFACGECPKTFKTAVGLGSHSKVHMPPKKCEFCGVEVIRNMAIHLRKEHPNELMSEEERDLRAENRRLGQTVERQAREIRTLRSKLGMAIRGGVSV